MPSIIEKDIYESLIPVVARDLIQRTQPSLPSQLNSVDGLVKGIQAYDQELLNWVTNLAESNPEHGQAWLVIVNSLRRYKRDECVWHKERMIAIISLTIFCQENPEDSQAKLVLEGLLRAWQDRYGEYGYKTLSEWQRDWDSVLYDIEIYELDQLEEQDFDDED